MTAAAALPETVTDNGTNRVDSFVTRNRGCTRCDKVRSDGHDPFDWTRHCTTCHADRHYACSECGACLPNRARWDRRYCSSSCRVRSWHAWRAEKAEWDDRRRAGDPEVLAADARLAAAAAAVRALNELGNEIQPPRLLTDIQVTARETAAVCGSCGIEMPTTQPVWRRPSSYLVIAGVHGQTVMPVCFGCRCEVYNGEHQPKHCAECRPRGRWVNVRWFCPNAYDPAHKAAETLCNGCHPATWDKASACEQCGRAVMQSIYLKRGTYFRRQGRGGYDLVTDRTFCSARCRRAYQTDARLAARARDPKPCLECGEHFDARADSRYCSSACRQRAYRQRQAGALA